MTIPTVYRWDDANAPVLSGQRNSLVNLLKACLVDGYGIKPSAGWTMPFFSANGYRGAFRNNPARGTGFFCYIDGETTANAYTVNFQGYEVLTSIDTGNGKFLAIDTNSFTISNVASTAARCWMIIATDKFFYLLLFPSVAPSTAVSGVIPIAVSNPGIFVFGDFEAAYITDAYPCIIAYGYMPAGSGNAYGFLTLSTASATSGVVFAGIPRTLSGVAGSLFCPATLVGGGPITSGYQYYFPAGSAPPYSDQIGLLLSRPGLNNGSAYSFRGWFPGFFIPYCTATSLLPLQIINKDGRIFVAVVLYYTALLSYCYFIEIGGGWS